MGSKQIIKIFVLLFALVGLTAAVVLVDQNQNIKEKAATATCSGMGGSCLTGGCYSGQADIGRVNCPVDYKCCVSQCISVGGSCKDGGCSAGQEDNGRLDCPVDFKCCITQNQTTTTCTSVGGSCKDGGCPSDQTDKGRLNCPVDFKCCASSNSSGGGNNQSNKCSSASNAKCDGKNLGDVCDSGKTCQKGANVEYGNDGLVACKCRTGSSGSGGSGGNQSSSPQATTVPTTQPNASPSVSPSPSASPGSGNLTLSVRLQGITSERVSVDGFIVTIKNNLGSLIKKFENQTTSASSQGIFNVNIDSSSFCGNTFNIFVKGKSHLQKKFLSVLIPCGTQNINKSISQNDELKAGDVNGDNIITIEDVSQVLRFYTDFSVPVVSTNTAMVSADINKDGRITIDDVALVALNWTDFAVPGDE